MKQAIVLCSGGLDSVTTAHYVKKSKRHDKINILFFDYGQRNIEPEKKCAQSCARDLKARFIKVNLSYLNEISTSLLNSQKKHKQLKKADLKDSAKESEKWYVPSRNLTFLANAIALAESIYTKEKVKADIFVGFKNEGKDSYPDATSKFLLAINKISAVSTNGKFKILAPLIKKDKEEIILLAKKLGLDFRKTFSCYIGDKNHCGNCLACMLRQQGFYWAGVEDPTLYLDR